MQPRLCKLFWNRLKCNILQQAIALSFYKMFVFELASSCDNILSKVMLVMFEGFEVLVTMSVVHE